MEKLVRKAVCACTGDWSSFRNSTVRRTKRWWLLAAESIRCPRISFLLQPPPERLVDAMLRALARGDRELTVPRRFAAGYVVQALAPGFMRRQVKRTTLVEKIRAKGLLPPEDEGQDSQ